ncbi:MAG: helix-turn-helix transcriptional regulator [Lachnospiraceae bacterium]|nr:helix-turn-helix transcriptional regulator [Lachnospiraceae bacterium]
MVSGSFTYTIGEMIMNMREQQGITQQKLCNGICSQKMMSRYELWTCIPDRLSLNLILQRLGKSPDHFVTILTQKEYQYLLWKRKIFIALQEDDLALREIRLKELFEAPEAWDRTCHKGLQEQFFQYVQGYIRQDVDKMKRAIKITVTDYDDELGKESFIGSTEMSYILLYLQTKEGMGANVKNELKACLDYIERYTVDESEKVKVYPRAVCLYCAYLEENVFERIEYCRKAISLLTGNGRLQELPELLRIMGNDLQKISLKDANRYQMQYWALQEVYKAQKMKINRKDKLLEDFNQEILLLNEILKTYRVERNLNREEVSEDICDVCSYARIESGTRGIKKSNFEKLIQRLEIPYGRYTSMLVTDNYECLMLARQGILASKFSDWERMESVLQRQKQLLDLEQIKNRQYLMEVENVLLYRTGQKTCEQFQETAIKALHLTVPKWNLQENLIHFYSNEEITLLNQIAISYRLQKKSEIGEQIIANVYETLEKSAIDLMERAEEAVMLLSTWKNLLTDLGEYDKAIEKADMGIKIALKSERGDKLDTLVYEKGWSNMHNEHHDEQHIHENLKICLQAYYISDLYRREKNSKDIKKFIEQNGMKIEY